MVMAFGDISDSQSSERTWTLLSPHLIWGKLVPDPGVWHRSHAACGLHRPEGGLCRFHKTPQAPSTQES